MDFNNISKGPRLVDFSKTPKIDVPSKPFLLKIKKWNINKILLIGFVLFTIFFLYNCKYGIFQ